VKWSSVANRPRDILERRYQFSIRFTVCWGVEGGHVPLKKKSVYAETDVAEVYNGKKLSEVFASFAAVYAVRSDSRLMADSLQRSLIIKDIVRFVRSNVSIFNA